MKSIRSMMILLCTVCLLAAPFCPTAASNSCMSGLSDKNGAVKADEWMKFLNDSLPVKFLSLPGTHDSGATRGPEALRTQGSTIAQQLEDGIRAFDVRLKSRKGKLGVYHSFVFQRIYWEEDVLPVMIAFLQKHPSEMLVVSLKREGGNADKYASLISASLLRAEYRPYIVHSFSDVMTLGDCRGKILFLHRDATGTEFQGVRCEGWQDNASCILSLRASDGSSASVWLQDEYQYASGNASEVQRKEQAIIHHFKQMAHQDASLFRWGISFISATGLPHGTPSVFARKLNGAVADYLTESRQRYCGIVLIDFVSETDGQRLVNTIIRCNNR